MEYGLGLRVLATRLLKVIRGTVSVSFDIFTRGLRDILIVAIFEVRAFTEGLADELLQATLAGLSHDSMLAFLCRKVDFLWQDHLAVVVVPNCV